MKEVASGMQGLTSRPWPHVPLFVGYSLLWMYSSVNLPSLLLLRALSSLYLLRLSSLRLLSVLVIQGKEVRLPGFLKR